MKNLSNFPVCERLAVAAILGFDFCDLFVERIDSKIRFVELVDAFTIPTVRHFSKQPLAVTKNTKTSSFWK